VDVALRKTVPLLLLGSFLLGAAPAKMGIFALQSGAPRTSGHLIVHAVHGHPLVRQLDFWMTRNGFATPIHRYDTDMTKLLHGVIVSDDFTTFMHVHPTLFPNGHFRLDQRFPRAARYLIYADGEPTGIGQQVFRFDLTVGSAPSKVARDLRSNGRSTTAGPYTVTLNRLNLATHGETLLLLHVLRHGKPAGDLHPYLGTLGHGVFLNAKDLTYVHVHPMALDAAHTPSVTSHSAAMPTGSDMDMHASPLPPNAVTSPSMLLHVAVREPGTYKLWFQFRGGDALCVASFVLTAT